MPVQRIVWRRLPARARWGHIRATNDRRVELDLKQIEVVFNDERGRQCPPQLAMTAQKPSFTSQFARRWLSFEDVEQGDCDRTVGIASLGGFLGGCCSVSDSSLIC